MEVEIRENIIIWGQVGLDLLPLNLPNIKLVLFSNPCPILLLKPGPKLTGLICKHPQLKYSRVYTRKLEMCGNLLRGSPIDNQDINFVSREDGPGMREKKKQKMVPQQDSLVEFLSPLINRQRLHLKGDGGVQSVQFKYMKGLLF